jgi:integrase
MVCVGWSSGTPERNGRPGPLLRPPWRSGPGGAPGVSGARILSRLRRPLWLERLERLARLGERSPGTVETYSRQLSGHVLQALGALRLQEVATPLVDRFTTDVHEHVGPATGRTCRSIVSGVMARAVRYGAVPANPTRELERLSARPRRVPRALSEEERARWFRALVGDRIARREDLFDLSAFLLATGLRIGEALAVLWREVDLDLGVLRVTSPLIRVTGRGLVRKGTKSQAEERVLQLPGWCVILLGGQRAGEGDW